MATRRAHEAVCVVAPVTRVREASLRATLRALPTGEHSPLSAPGTVHFGRFVLIDQVEGRDGAPLEPRVPLLLFAADCDGPAEVLLGALTQAPDGTADRIWGCCDGWPGSRDRAGTERWFAAHRVTLGFSIAPYAGTSVAEVRDALAARARLARFAVEAQDLGPQALKERWGEVFGGDHLGKGT